jgi:hypothetical protein
MSETPVPLSEPALSKGAAAPGARVEGAKPVELAPEGVLCPHCGARMRVYARYAKSVEYVCPSLKEDPPVLADKYVEWRNLYLKSRVNQAL